MFDITNAWRAVVYKA